MHESASSEQEGRNVSLISLEGGHYVVARRIKKWISLPPGSPVLHRIQEHVANNALVIHLGSPRTVRSILLLDGGYLLLTSEHEDTLSHRV